METVVHDTGDTTEALFVPGIWYFFTSGRYTRGPLKNGLQGDAMSGNSFLNDREDLRFRIKKCSKNGLVSMKISLFGAIENDGGILLSYFYCISVMIC